MKSHRLIALTFALILLSACSEAPPLVPDPVHVPQPEATAAPATEAVSSEAPADPTARPVPSAFHTRAYGEAERVTAGLRETAIGEEWFSVNFDLPRETTREQVLAALTVSGPANPRITIGGLWSKGNVELIFPEGRAGDVHTVRLTGPVGDGGLKADLGFRITRYPSPSVTAELKRSGGDWEPLKEAAVLPEQPLAFRFRISGGIDPELLRQKIREQLKAAHSIDQPAPDTLTVTVPAPPPLINLDFAGLKGQYGAITAGGVTVYSGEQPVLVLLDPSTGQEERLMEVPPDLLSISASPDGQWLMLTGMGPGSVWWEQVRVVSLRTGQIRLTPFRAESSRSSPVVWAKDQLFLPVRNQVQVWNLTAGTAEVRPSRAAWWETASPDGRYLAGFDYDLGRETENWLAPASIYLHDTVTAKEQVLTDAFNYRVPHKGGYPSTAVAWEADGRHLLVEDYPASGGPARGLRVDVPSGRIEPQDGPAPQRRKFEEWRPGSDGWSVAFSHLWGPVRFRAPDGRIIAHGSGLLGPWTEKNQLLVVRWKVKQRRERNGA